MYCRYCGRELPNTAVFCAYCGRSTKATGLKDGPIKRDHVSQIDVLTRANKIASRFVPDRLAERFPTVMPVAFIGMYVAVLFVAIVVVSGITGTISHDLSGTYQTTEFFPIAHITFQTNGNFTAVNYAGYTETYQGKYSKKINGEYTLRFTGGSASGGSPVTQFEASEIGKQYELVAKKLGENSLQVRIVPKIGYYAWGNTTVNFYK